MAVKIALAGNPNCGKTTLFNALTGSNQFVGNWPGVTVEKKEGKLKGHKDVVIMDLPGIYSLSPYTLEEVVARNYLIAERPDAILNIVDGTNIERNLYLSTQLMELGIPVIMAVNMMDVVEKSGEKIHTDKLSKKLGCEVVEISALKGTGIKEAAEKAVKLAESRKAAVVAHEFSKEAEDIIAEVEGKIKGMPEEQKRFFAIKLLEKDDKINEMMTNVPDVSAEIKEMEDKFDDDTESVITNERYVYISSIIGDCVTKNTKAKLTTSDKIDRIVTNRWLALPIFAVVMFIVYFVSVTTVGAFVGVKFMIRLNPMDERSKYTVRYCAEAVNAAESAGLPIFIEALYVETTETGFTMKTDSESLCKVVGVVGALGCRASGKWIEVPLNHEYAVPTAATTCPVLVVPDEVKSEPIEVVEEYTKEIGISSNIRGILLGRNVMYNESDPLPIAEAIADIWHKGGNAEENYKRCVEKL